MMGENYPPESLRSSSLTSFLQGVNGFRKSEISMLHLVAQAWLFDSHQIGHSALRDLPDSHGSVDPSGEIIIQFFLLGDINLWHLLLLVHICKLNV